MPPKMKVVVTRQLIDEAQKLLDAQGNLEIVQWNSEKAICSRPARYR
jgi:glyoxylate/hydroxypyruvate reductase